MFDKKTTSNQEDWEDVVEFCEGILSDVDELPERAGDFAESVRDRVEGIKEFIEENRRFTQNQYDALANMHNGVHKWLDR